MSDKKNLISAIVSGNVGQLEENNKIAGRRKYIISNFLDLLKFHNCVDRNGHFIDRKKQIENGEIEVEYRDPIKTAFERLFEEGKRSQIAIEE